MHDVKTDGAQQFFVGAYATAPSLVGWDPGAEGIFLDGVLAMDGVAGLELPFTGQLHLRDESWFLQRLQGDAEFVVTALPGTMARLHADAGFGLASTSAPGRQAAVEFAKDALKAIERLNARAGRSATRALELHTAPVAAPGASSVAALVESLSEIASWDWGGVRLVLEHCDALSPGWAPAKGFLSLDAEIDAVNQVNERGGHPFGIAINWGRSVIEQRRSEAGVEHISRVRDAGLLGGVVLSGCADNATRYGSAWADVHVPPAPCDGPPSPARVGGSSVQEIDLLEAGSLLNLEGMKQSLNAAGTDPDTGFRAIKIAAPPNATVDERISTISATLALAHQAS